MVDKRIKREEIKSVRKRLKEMAPEVIARREINYNIQRERRRRTLASNAQALHDSYLSAISKSPHMDGLRAGGITAHVHDLKTFFAVCTISAIPSWDSLRCKRFNNIK